MLWILAWISSKTTTGILTLLLTSCLTWGTLLDLFRFQCPYLPNRVKTNYPRGWLWVVNETIYPCCPEQFLTQSCLRRQLVLWRGRMNECCAQGVQHHASKCPLDHRQQKVLENPWHRHTRNLWLGLVLCSSVDSLSHLLQGNCSYICSTF